MIYFQLDRKFKRLEHAAPVFDALQIYQPLVQLTPDGLVLRVPGGRKPEAVLLQLTKQSVGDGSRWEIWSVDERGSVFIGRDA